MRSRGSSSKGLAHPRPSRPRSGSSSAASTGTSVIPCTSPSSARSSVRPCFLANSSSSDTRLLSPQPSSSSSAGTRSPRSTVSSARSTTPNGEQCRDGGQDEPGIADEPALPVHSLTRQDQRKRRSASLHTVARSRETSSQKAERPRKKMNPRAAAPGGSYL